MHFLTCFMSLALPLAAAQTFSNNVIFTPPDNYNDPRTLYARTLQLDDGSLLATWENYSPEPPQVWFPIVKSTDGGQTWNEISQVHDQVNGFGLRYQPFLYQLPQAIGDFEEGTVLLSGSSIPTNLSSTHIELYASRDLGVTWEFVSHVAAGGEALPNHGLTPVWEPFLMVHDDELVLYYADQRDNATHSQRLSHQTSADLVNWSDVVVDVAYNDFYQRPGMPVVAKLPTGDFFYVYEFGGETSSSSYWFPIYYRISSYPLAFSAATHQKLTSDDGTTPTGSPYVVWSSYGGDNGTIVVSAGDVDHIFTNQMLGHPDGWKKWNVPEPKSYTRTLLIFEEDPDLLMITGAGKLPPSTTNKVTTSVVRLSKIMKKCKGTL